MSWRQYGLDENFPLDSDSSLFNVTWRPVLTSTRDHAYEGRRIHIDEICGVANNNTCVVELSVVEIMRLYSSVLKFCQAADRPDPKA